MDFRNRTAGFRGNLFFNMPMPDRPVAFVGECGESLSGIHRVRVSDGVKDVAVVPAIPVGVRLPQIESGFAPQGSQSANLGRSENRFADHVTGPESALFGELGGADPSFDCDAARFHFPLERRSRVLCKRFESATEQNNFVFLPRMPEDASDAFVEKREGVEVTQGARSAHLRQVTFVGALYGE